MQHPFVMRGIGDWARGLALALAIAPLGACALANAGSGPAPQLFTLTAPHPASVEATAAKGPPIEVAEFSAPAALDTTRIAQQSTPNEIAYYADARWADRAPRMIQMLMVETLENSGRFNAVSPQGAGLRVDYELMGDIRQFAAVPSTNGGTSEVRVDLLARLVKKDERNILASSRFSARAPVEGSGIVPIVRAYDAALRGVLDGMADWAAQQAAAAGGGTTALSGR